MPRQPLSLFSPAKINLFLHITGRLNNGYHTLDSLVAFADIGDHITLHAADTFSLNIQGPYANDLSPNDTADNLITKATYALAKHLGKRPNIKITLTKNLPIAAGIGGGSSNAAATIRGLIQWWDASCKDDDLQDICTKLGADMPVCYHNKPAYMQGTGEIITPLKAPLPELGIILINPNKPCPTQPVFAQIKPPYSSALTLPEDFQSQTNLITFLKEQRNDLTNAACSAIPDIQMILDTLNNEPECQIARLSGSGATCFGLFTNKNAANKAAQTLKKNHPDCWIESGTIS